MKKEGKYSEFLNYNLDNEATEITRILKSDRWKASLRRLQVIRQNGQWIQPFFKMVLVDSFSNKQVAEKQFTTREELNHAYNGLLHLLGYHDDCIGAISETNWARWMFIGSIDWIEEDVSIFQRLEAKDEEGW